MRPTPFLLRLRLILNLWPPFLVADIRGCAIDADFRSAEAELRMRPWNRNYVGTHFGGSLFAMADPFWMLLTMHALWHGYVVWDKAGEIEFVAPGRGTVRDRFVPDEAALRSLRFAGVSNSGLIRSMTRCHAWRNFRRYRSSHHALSFMRSVSVHRLKHGRSETNASRAICTLSGIH